MTTFVRASFAPGFRPRRPTLRRARASARDTSSRANNDWRGGDGTSDDADPARSAPKRVTIVGGGMAGLGCLRALSGVEDVQCTLLESTRVLGGRVRSKTALGALAFDHGASYFTCKSDDAPFAEVLRAAESAGAVQPWSDPDGSHGSVGTARTVLDVSAGHHVLDPESFEPFPESKRLYVGAPSMASLPSFVADRLARAESPEASWVGDNATPGVPEYLCGAYVDRIAHLAREDTASWGVRPHSQSARRWGMMLRCREGGHMWYKPWECDALVLATNAPAAAKLLHETSTPASDDGGVARAAVHRLADAAAAIRGDPCWSLTVAFDRNLRLPHRGVALRPPHDSGIVWFANNSSKPGRPSEGRGAASAGWGYRWAEVGRAPQTGEGECWVVQASGAWSAARSNRPPDDVARELCRLFLRVVGRDDGSVAAVHCKATKWNFAFPLNPASGDVAGASSKAPRKCLWEPEIGLGACGDWTSGPRAGDAYDAGYEMGRTVVEHLRGEASRDA